MITTLKNVRPVWWAALAGCFIFTLLFAAKFLTSSASANDSEEPEKTTNTMPYTTISYTADQYNSLNDELDQTRSRCKQAAERSQQLENQLVELQTQNENAAKELEQHKQELQVARNTETKLQSQNQDLDRDNQRLQQQLQHQKQQVSTSSTSELTGNWKLRVNVESVVSATLTYTTNRVVEYDVWIDVRSGQVRGAMHGIKDVSKMISDSPSTGNGTISGTYADGEMVFCVGKTSSGPVSRFRLRTEGDQLIGRLEVESLASGWQVYEGSVVGSRTTEL